MSYSAEKSTRRQWWEGFCACRVVRKQKDAEARLSYVFVYEGLFMCTGYRGEGMGGAARPGAARCSHLEVREWAVLKWSHQGFPCRMGM